VQKILETGDIEQALKVLARSPELQLSFQRPAFRHFIIRASMKGDLRAVEQCVPPSAAFPDVPGLKTVAR
jgi:hypothetical protein